MRRHGQAIHRESKNDLKYMGKKKFDALPINATISPPHTHTHTHTHIFTHKYTHILNYLGKKAN